MAGQFPSRRELLQALALASTASMFSGFSRWSYALGPSGLQHAHAAQTHTPVHPIYHPSFFSPEQYQTVEVLAELILPATAHARSSKATPKLLQAGAKEAGVAEFLDFIVLTDSSLHLPFQNGLEWLDRASTPAHSFRTAKPADQDALLTRLAYKAGFRDDEKPGQQFFKLFRKYTVMGFYTSRIGLESLDYPGLQFYGTSPGCTHEGNPEHVGL